MFGGIFMAKYAVIGGTGVYDFKDGKSKIISTEYGDVNVDICNLYGEDVVFLARHGKNHNIPPHKINYRANIKALKDLGVEYIFATAAVGSCNPAFKPGDVVVIKDFLDFTKCRKNTFYDGEDGKVFHLEMSAPYSKDLRNIIFNVAGKNDIELKGEGVYVCTEGPRFETASEIKMFQKLGGDVVGMTGVPEVCLANELGICYSSIAFVVNWCTGIVEKIHGEEIGEHKNKCSLNIKRLIEKIIQEGIDSGSCKCESVLL